MVIATKTPPSLPVLTAEQQAASNFEDGRALVLAVAGSGKTQMLLHRVRRLIVEDGVAPERILVLMFNTHAAESFNGRLREYGVDNFSAGTFHSFAKVLVEAYENNGIENPADWTGLSILENNENYLAYIYRVLIDYNRSLGKNEQEFAIKDDPATRMRLMGFIEALKNNDYPYCGKLKQSDFSKYAGGSRRASQFLAFFDFYEERRKREGVYAFTDLLYRLRELFACDDEFREQMQTWYDYVMVDEYQDSNTVQHFLVNTLAPKSLMLVGDDDQSIYSFRGAKPEYITLGLFEDYRDTQVFRLSQTFRYGPVVSLLSNALISRNLNRSDKICISAQAAPDTKVGLFSTNEGFNYITNHLEELQGYKVLVRTNNEADAINFLLWTEGTCGIGNEEKGFWGRSDEGAFLYDALNCAVTGEQRMSKAATRYMMSAAGKNAFLYMTNGETDAFLEEASGKSAMDAVRNKGLATPYTDIKAALRRIYRFLNNLPKFRDQPLQDLLLFFNSEMPDMRAGELLRAIYARSGQWKTEDFYRAMHRKAVPCDIEVMTVHAAKGATFDKVLIPHLREKVFPYNFGEVISEEELEEERRLFYVAVTRCRRELRITFPDVPAFNAALQKNDAQAASSFCDVQYAPSRFIFEMEPLLALSAGNEVRYGGQRVAKLPYTSKVFQRYLAENKKLMTLEPSHHRSPKDISVPALNPAIRKRKVRGTWDGVSYYEKAEVSPLARDEAKRAAREAGVLIRGKDMRELNHLSSGLEQVYREHLSSLNLSSSNQHRDASNVEYYFPELF